MKKRIWTILASILLIAGLVSALTACSNSNGLMFSGGSYENTYTVSYKDKNNAARTEIEIPAIVAGDKTVTAVVDFTDAIYLKTVKLPDTITIIELNTFKGCTALETINIPASVTKIGTSAFEGCTSLKEIVIEGDKVTIESKAFKDCTSLSKIVLADTITCYPACDSFENTAYSNNSQNWVNGALYVGTHLVNTNSSLPQAVEVKDGTIAISNGAFDNCSISSISFPASIKYIPGGTFRTCSSLTRATFAVTTGWKNKDPLKVADPEWAALSLRGGNAFIQE